MTTQTAEKEYQKAIDGLERQIIKNQPRVALYARVSTEEQTEQNQLEVLTRWADERGYQVFDVYKDIGSAWQHSDRKELNRLLNDCRLGKVKVVMVWDLSRLSREGPLAIMTLVKRFGDYNVRVMSYQEAWLESAFDFKEVLLAMCGWFARWESQIRSENTKAGMNRAKAQGKHVGRPKKR